MQSYDKPSELRNLQPHLSITTEANEYRSASQPSLEQDIARVKEILKADGRSDGNRSHTHRLVLGVVVLCLILGAASVLVLSLFRQPVVPAQSATLHATPSVLPSPSPAPTAIFNIRSVNFQKRTYQASEGAIRGDSRDAQIKVSFGDLTGDEVEEAAVLLNYGGGGSGWFSEVFVYGVNETEKGISEIAVIHGGDRANGGVKDALIRAGHLRVRTYEGSCNACLEFLITTVYAFNERQHRQISQSKTPISDW